MQSIIKFLISAFFFVSCTQQEEQKSSHAFAPKVVEAKGYVVPKDSMADPKVILVDESKLIKIPVGNPRIVPTNTNVHIAGIPKIIIAGNPRVCTPGQGTFLLPKIVAAIEHPMAAGVPEVVLAKDAYIKDQNPENFSSFGKLQGLKHSMIRSILEDTDGNLWISTYGGGVSKYDGKSFTHFTEKEGLCNNYIFSMLKDKNGNLWFGSDGKGISKYDGKNFTNYTEEEGLINNYVFSMLEDKSGNLWFGTDGGVCKFDGNNSDAKQKYFTHFTKEAGLNYNEVACIFQDKSGNIWFGTDGGGISKYDGKSFFHFTKKEGLSNNSVLSIAQDNDGSLWFGTFGGGVTKYDGKSFIHFTEKEGLSNNSVMSILRDKNGTLWFGTFGGGVSKYDGKSFTHFTEKEGLSNNSVFSILQDKSGNFWFSTDGGVNKYNGLNFTHFTEKEGLSNNSVLSILQDKNGILWFGTFGGGVSKYNGKSFIHFTEKEGLNDNYVFSILEDKFGNLWFGTNGGGVIKYDGNRVEAIERGENISLQDRRDLMNINNKFIKCFTHFSEKDGLSNNQVFSISQDINGNLWIGTDDGVSKLAISETQGTTHYTFTNFTKNEGLSNNRIFCIKQDHHGNLWFGTDGGGVSKYYQNNAKGNNRISFTHFTTKEGLNNNYIFSIFEDKTGNLWFGTDGGGVIKYDGNRVESIESGENIPQQDRTDLNIRNDKLIKSFTYFTENEGLSNNTVKSILQDKNGNLWFGTRFGLSKLTGENLNKYIVRYNKEMAGNFENSKSQQPVLFKNYTYEDGFLGIGCFQGAIYQDNRGTLWIGANDRLTAHHSEGDDPDTIPPNIQITDIELFNEKIAWQNLCSQIKNQKSKENAAFDTSFTLGNGVRVGNFKFDSLSRWYNLPVNLSLAYNNNYITFNFIGITQKQNKKVKYQYKLEGIDENWSALTSRTEAPYGNIPQGTYTFKAKAMNSEGWWSHELNYTFIIRPPWWRTLWFRVLLISFGVLSIFSYIKWRELKLIHDKNILENKVKEQTYALIEKNEELNQQNEEITAQRDEIEAQRDIVVLQNNIIENKNKNITDSIRYAQHIQQVILPTEEKLNALFNNYFVFYLPKDIVSGDFYWAEQINNASNETITLFATVDCTGHGVPGAFMSLMGYNGLSQAIKGNALNKPSDILNYLSNYISEMLRQREDKSYANDGMDLFLCSLNKNTMVLEYAGVHNSAWLVRKGEVITLKTDSHPIGYMYTNGFKGYTNKHISLQTGDCIYLFTDGFMDQFGKQNHKKFTSKRFKELLAEVHDLSMNSQKQKLSETFETWKLDEIQTDDVLVMGIKV